MSITRLSSSLQSGNAEVEISHRRAEGIFLKLSLGSLLGFILLVAIIWGGHGAYVRWQEKRLIRKAEAAMQQGDRATASLAARAALQLKPESLPANRLAAEIAENAGDKSALAWRRKVAQDKDHSAEDVLALARSALQFNDLATAKMAVATLPDADRQTGGFHAVAALIAQADKQYDKAAAEWAEAARLSPDEKAYQLQLGAAELRLDDKAHRDRGVAILDGLRSDPKYRSAATRTLINDGITRHESADKILELARELRGYPDVTFGDRLLIAELLRQSNDSEFTAFLTELEKSAVNRPEDLAALLRWMSRTNSNLLALDFIRTMKPEQLQAWPVSMAVADIYLRLNDWSKLEASAKSQDWRDFDFLRHAYIARAMREQGKTAASDNEWSLAVKGAAAGSEQATLLIQTAGSWNWRDEQIDLLWTLAKFPDKEKESLQTLYGFFLKSHDTHGLFRVLVRLAEFHPDDLDVQNNLAQVSLLLESKTDDARRIAANVYHKQPNNPAYATTYAFSLLTKGDTKGAAKVMSSLTSEQLKDPSVSVYYGVCLAALNDPRARDYLDAADKTTLLPEEKTLVERAKNGLSIGGTSSSRP